MSSPNTSVTTPTTAALAPRMTRRCGTAASVVRICPVVYSEAKTRTPRMPTARTGYSSQPRKIDATGSAGGLLVPSERAITTLPPTAVTAAMSNVQ